MSQGVERVLVHARDEILHSLQRRRFTFDVGGDAVRRPAVADAEQILLLQIEHRVSALVALQRKWTSMNFVIIESLRTGLNLLQNQSKRQLLHPGSTSAPNRKLSL